MINSSFLCPFLGKVRKIGQVRGQKGAFYNRKKSYDNFYFRGTKPLNQNIKKVFIKEENLNEKKFKNTNEKINIIIPCSTYDTVLLGLGRTGEGKR